MTRTLILMRHAKSSWSDPDTPDHDRPLNKRGRRSAAALGDWLREHGLTPDQVLCSSALRAKQTCDGLGLGLPAPLAPGLYHADPTAMRAALRSATGQCVLMIGHNPGIGDFAQRLVAQAPAHDRFHDYPTGATLVADFAIAQWDSLDFGQGVARAFVIPRSLPGVDAAPKL